MTIDRESVEGGGTSREEETKTHRCMRCNEVFACQHGPNCQAGQMVLPVIVSAGSYTTIEHCPPSPDWNWIRAYGDRMRAAGHIEATRVAYAAAKAEASGRPAPHQDGETHTFGGTYDDPPHCRNDYQEVWRSGYRAGHEAASSSRPAPLPPAVLADALNDRIGPASGRLLSASPLSSSRPAPQGWQPLSTAPKMRTILLFAATEDGTVKNWKMATGAWHTGYEDERSKACHLTPWNWGGSQLKIYDVQPTHWMPLPDPPVVPCVLESALMTKDDDDLTRSARPANAPTHIHAAENEKD